MFQCCWTIKLLHVRPYNPNAMTITYGCHDGKVSLRICVCFSLIWHLAHNHDINNDHFDSLKLNCVHVRCKVHWADVNSMKTPWVISVDQGYLFLQLRILNKCSILISQLNKCAQYQCCKTQYITCFISISLLYCLNTDVQVTSFL